MIRVKTYQQPNGEWAVTSDSFNFLQDVMATAETITLKHATLSENGKQASGTLVDGYGITLNEQISGRADIMHAFNTFPFKRSYPNDYHNLHKIAVEKLEELRGMDLELIRLGKHVAYYRPEAESVNNN